MAGNKRKDMKFVSMWALPEEEKDIDRILKKPIKEEFDLAQLGDIIGSINARGDFVGDQKIKEMLKKHLESVENVLEQFPAVYYSEDEKLWFIRNNLILGIKNKLVEQLRDFEK